MLSKIPSSEFGGSERRALSYTVSSSDGGFLLGRASLERDHRSSTLVLKVGLDNGWMPKVPRGRNNKCAALVVTVPQSFSGTYLPWQMGEDGAGNIPAIATVLYPWSPNNTSNALRPPPYLQEYTLADFTYTLQTPTCTATNDRSMDGWYNTGDTTPAPTPIYGCSILTHERLPLTSPYRLLVV